MRLAQPQCFRAIAASLRFYSAAVENSVQLSPSCIARLKQICDDKSFLRVSVEGGGCSGFQYKFSIEQTMATDDLLIDRDGARIAVDTESMSYLKGSTVDYHVELIRSGFRIVNNPGAEQGCSCGASFSIKVD